MKKGQIIEGIVQRVDFPNKGIVESAEGICMVKNALPGQRVQCAINKVRKGKAEGRLLQVLEPSRLECGSPCPHFGSCGGCTYLSLPYEEQLRIKEAQVKKLLDSVLAGQASNWKFEGIKASPVCFGYRNKMEFSFGDEVKDGPLALGMHKRGSFYDIVSVTDCQIIDEDYRRILRCVKAYFAGLQEQGTAVSFYHRLRHVGYLRHLLVRKAAKTGEILIALVTTSQMPAGMERREAVTAVEGRLTVTDAKMARKQTAAAEEERQLAEAELLNGFRKQLLSLELAGKIVGILHVQNDAVADVVQSDETTILYGQDYFYEELLGLRFKVSVFSFFQTNSLGAEVLYETAREYIADLIGEKAAQTVFDLYSGTGTIAQLMAPVAKKVIGVEIVEEAVAAARNNAALNGLHNCEFIAGDVLKVIDGIEEKPDLIILDPPRDGIHPKALDKIIRYGVEHILYISCKPTSLARDLEVFLARGYKVEKAVAVDQFPWTANVETCVLLTHKKPTSYIEVTMDYDKIVSDQKPRHTTYKMITEYVKEKYNLVVKSTTIADMKRSFGLEVGDYNVKEEKTNYRKEKITPEKRQAVEDALRYFGVIE